MSNQNMYKNLDKMKNMLNVSLIDILIPQIKSNQNENVINMLDIVKDKPDAYVNLLSVAIFHKNLKIVELILEKYFTSDIEEPYINSYFLYNAILPENSKNKLTDNKNNYTEELCPFAVMAGIGGDIGIFKCLWQKNLINSFNINNSGIIGLTKKYKNVFFSNIIGACAYYGNEKLLEYILTNYRTELDININSIEKKSKKSTKFHFSKEYSEYTPIFLSVGGYISDKKTLDILKIFEEYRANFESKDFNENNIIHIATKEKKIMTLKFLIESLELKTFMNEYNLNNETPYILAQQSKNEEIIKFFDSYNTEDENLIKQNLDELINEDTKKKNRKQNKKQKNKKDNLTLLNSSEYEETLGFNQDKQEEEKNDLENENNEQIEEESYGDDKIEGEKEEEKEEKVNEQKNEEYKYSEYNNKKYKNKKDNYYGKKYYDDNDKYKNPNKKYDDYKYDNKYIKYNSGNNLYHNKSNIIYNKDTFKKSKSNYDFNNEYNNKYKKGKYYTNNKNEYYDYNNKENRGSKREQREKYNNNNKKSWSNKDNYYINKKPKAIAVEINGEEYDNQNSNNNYNNNEQAEDNIDIKENLNDVNMENNKTEDKKNQIQNNNILSKEKEKEDENLKEEEEDDYSYSEEDFLSQSDKKEKEVRILKLSLSEYNELQKKCLDAERKVNILEKENLELSNCIKKIYIENNHKIDQNIPNEETNINSLMALTNEELDKKDKLIKKLKTEAKMADLSDIEKLKKEELKEFKNLYNKNLKIINDALKQFGKE